MITYTCLSPHPPLIIPAVGGENIKQAAATVQAMEIMARELVETAPEVVVFLTPHGNVFADCISCLTELHLTGDFGNFGRQDISTSRINDLELVEEIARQCEVQGIEFLGLDEKTARQYHLNAHIDHGILVPLYYLDQAGLGEVPIAAISIGYLSIEELYAFGNVIREAAARLGKKVAVVASGDMSHCLKEEGPYNYHPDGPRFDASITAMINEGNIQGIMDIPEKFRDNAGECGYRSLVIMLGALDGSSFAAQVFSYEGPFGVGYLVAGFRPTGVVASLLTDLKRKQLEAERQSSSQESLPVKWARLVLESYIKTGEMPELPKELAQLKEEKAAAFVSLKKHGRLRGCIGTIIPCYQDLAEEIATNAISAGTRDPRFASLKKSELGQLVYSVDILGEPELCTRADLHPQKYGVIVSRGNKRGLLLPDLEGVDTVEQQLAIALEKAGIPQDQDFAIQRFEVKRYT